MKPKIILLAALGSEVEPLRKQLPNTPIYLTGVGKVAAAMNTQRAILQEKPDALVFVGVAGGLNDQLQQLDVVIAEDCAQWDVDLRPINGGELGTLNDGRRFISLDAHGTALALQSAIALGLRAHLGRVISGDSFMADTNKAKQLAQEFTASAIEMEGAAAAQVANDNNIPMVLIRVISDGANDDAALNFEEFLNQAAMHAANISAHFLPLWQEHLAKIARGFTA